MGELGTNKKHTTLRQNAELLREESKILQEKKEIRQYRQFNRLQVFFFFLAAEGEQWMNG